MIKVTFDIYSKDASYQEIDDLLTGQGSDLTSEDLLNIQRKVMSDALEYAYNRNIAED